MQALSLGSCLFVFWLLLSGHGEPLLLGLGLLSSALAVFIAWRLGAVDDEHHPALHGLPLYWLWLAGEIIKCNLQVLRLILTPKLAIQPQVIEVEAHEKTELGRVIYANSITLTPGTLTLALNGARLSVHALTDEAANDLKAGEMDRRVVKVEGAVPSAGEAQP
jgi:multicomponent Na+:H+ antiporter subunit E